MFCRGGGRRPFEGGEWKRVARCEAAGAHVDRQGDNVVVAGDVGLGPIRCPNVDGSQKRSLLRGTGPIMLFPFSIHFLY